MIATTRKMTLVSCVACLFVQYHCIAFQIPKYVSQYHYWETKTILHLSSSDSFKQSRLAGNQREPTNDEIKIMDEMIYKLANAKPYDLPSSVQRAFRVISSPRFFVRIAELTDITQDDIEKAKLITLADNLVSTLDAVVSTAQDKLQEYAKDVESVVKAAAEPDSGEFFVPLSSDRLDAMRIAMNKLDPSNLDGDTFLSTVDAWMNKSHQDGLDLMVVILQNVLQLYAGRRILDARETSTSASGKLLDTLLQTDSDRWDSTIRNGITQSEDITAESLIVEVQKNMESIILSLESGSIAQRVQAEYLQEMVKRIEIVQKSI